MWRAPRRHELGDVGQHRVSVDAPHPAVEHDGDRTVATPVRAAVRRHDGPDEPLLVADREAARSDPAAGGDRAPGGRRPSRPAWRSRGTAPRRGRRRGRVGRCPAARSRAEPGRGVHGDREAHLVGPLGERGIPGVDRTRRALARRGRPSAGGPPRSRSRPAAGRARRWRRGGSRRVSKLGWIGDQRGPRADRAEPVDVERPSACATECRARMDPRIDALLRGWRCQCAASPRRRGPLQMNASLAVARDDTLLLALIDRARPGAGVVVVEEVDVEPFVVDAPTRGCREAGDDEVRGHGRRRRRRDRHRSGRSS